MFHPHPAILKPHAYRAIKLDVHALSVGWQITKDGLYVSGKIEDTGRPPSTVRRIWTDFGESIKHWAFIHRVPVELIIATAATETGGDPSKVREEPGYISDKTTPHRVSPGLMQTLISTARFTVGTVDGSAIDREWLLIPHNSIRAGTSYIGGQRVITDFDPPKVFAAYNAGNLYAEFGKKNRWKMRQYPIGTSEHVDRGVRWFNDCFTMFEEDGGAPPMSFYAALNN